MLTNMDHLMGMVWCSSVVATALLSFTDLAASGSSALSAHCQSADVWDGDTEARDGVISSAMSNSEAQLMSERYCLW